MVLKTNGINLLFANTQKTTDKIGHKTFNNMFKPFYTEVRSQEYNDSTLGFIMTLEKHNLFMFA